VKSVKQLRIDSLAAIISGEGDLKISIPSDTLEAREINNLVSLEFPKCDLIARNTERFVDLN